MLLRHAKSSWKDITKTDHERPLNKRGKNDASKLGKTLKKINIMPDIIISSTAIRAIETAKLVAQYCEYNKELETDPLLYASSYIDYLNIISTISDENQKAMVVGHNPTIEDVIQRLTGITEIIPTCTMIYLDLNIESWKLIKTIGYSDVHIIKIIKPKKKES